MSLDISTLSPAQMQTALATGKGPDGSTLSSSDMQKITDAIQQGLNGNSTTSNVKGDPSAALAGQGQDNSGMGLSIQSSKTTTPKDDEANWAKALGMSTDDLDNFLSFDNKLGDGSTSKTTGDTKFYEELRTKLDDPKYNKTYEKANEFIDESTQGFDDNDDPTADKNKGECAAGAVADANKKITNSPFWSSLNTEKKIAMLELCDKTTVENGNEAQKEGITQPGNLLDQYGGGVHNKGESYNLVKFAKAVETPPPADPPPPIKTKSEDPPIETKEDALVKIQRGAEGYGKAGVQGSDGLALQISGNQDVIEALKKVGDGQKDGLIRLNQMTLDDKGFVQLKLPSGKTVYFDRNKLGYDASSTFQVNLGDINKYIKDTED